METLSIKKSELRKIIKESIREAIIEERANLYESLIPSISPKEMKNIKTLFKTPLDYDKKNFKDLTDWIMK